MRGDLPVRPRPQAACTAFRAELGRAPDAVALGWMRDALAGGGSIADIRRDIARSPEAASGLQAAFQAMLGRAPDGAALGWMQDILARGGSVAEVRGTLAGSAEVEGGVRGLYLQVLGRDADPGGLAWARSLLAGGASLDDVGAFLATSSEAVTLAGSGRNAPVPVASSPTVAATSSPTFETLAAQYSPDRPNYHHYTFDSYIGQIGGDATPEVAYRALLKNAVPGGEHTGSVIQDGQISTARFAGQGGSVITFLEPSSRSIINATQPDHTLHDGVVQRVIVVDGNAMYVRTVGIGNNSSQLWNLANEAAAEPAFYASTIAIRKELYGTIEFVGP